MRTEKFLSVIAGVCALTGQDPNALSTQALSRLVAIVNQRLKEGWEYEFWPEWTVVEQRAYRDAWNSGIAYAAGTQVWHAPDWSYYQANSAPNTPLTGDEPSSTSTTWSPLTVFERYVSLDQTGQTPIGEVIRVNRSDPRINIRFPGPLAFAVVNEGILVAPLAGPQVWITFRQRPPLFSSTLWNNQVANALGDIVYRPSTTGQCYLCTAGVSAPQSTAPESSPSWSQVNFPARLSHFVKRASYADWLRSSGQGDKAAAEEMVAYNHLSQASDIVFASQGQFDRASAQVYC